MRIRILYFAVVRERLRLGEEQLDVEDGTLVGGLLDRLCLLHPALVALRPHVRIARNRQAVSDEESLADGDEIALIPPVSGGAAGEGENPARLIGVRSHPLDLMEVVRAVSHEGAGGIATFTGIVRRQSRGHAIERLEYEAYRAMAEQKLDEIAAALETAHGARVAILHRVGSLLVGEVAVVIAASAAHREEAFAACREAIERLKQEAPIWKKEIGEGGEEWIGMGP